MNGEEFRVAGKQMVDYIADYLENIRERPVLPSVEPFYIRQVVPADPPEKPEKWSDVFGDIEKVVMNGMTHWHSPYFYCYFPTGNSYPAILGGMLSDALSCIGFTWYSSPACTELEMQMCDWMAKALGLPDFFMFNNNGLMGNKGQGGGVIQGSISESTLVTMLAAKRIAVEKIRKAILKTAENRTKEELKHLEQRNQRLKQGFLNLLKDVIRKADELQENNKFLNRNQLKDETSRLISSFFNKKDKTQETVSNSKLISNLSLESTKSVESARFSETNQPAELISQQSKASKWNLNGNLRENDKVNSLNGLNRDKKANKDSEDERMTNTNGGERILTNGKMNGNKSNGYSNGNDKRYTNGNGSEKAPLNGNERRFSNGSINGSHKPLTNGNANGDGADMSLANGTSEDEKGDRSCRCNEEANSSSETILDLHLQYLLLTDSNFSSDTAKLVVYCSDQAHSSVEKAAMLASVIVRKVKATPNEESDLGMDGLALEKAIIRDLECGLVPFYVCATLGTTSSLAFDKLDEVGLVTKKYDLWLHVDAAYAGSALVCPEYRHIMKGVEYTDSFGMNPHKWLLVNFDCSMLWVKDSSHLERAMNVSPAYLKHEKEGQIPDYRHWQIPLGRRFRSLKVWFVMRMYGIAGLQNHIRKQINLAIAFSNMIKANDRFELTHPVIMGLVCFRLKGPNELNERLVNTINRRKRMHILSTIVAGQYIIRFAVCSRFTELSDIEIAYRELLDALEEVENPPIEEDPLNCIRN